MRLVTALFAMLALAACGDDPAPLFADAVWQVQCRCYGMCSAIPTRDVQHLDGEDGHNVACEVFERSGRRVLTASVSRGSEFELEIRDAEFMGMGGPVSGGCQVTVVEGGNEFRGACSANPPTVAQPCRISNLVINTDMDGNQQIEGDLLCFHLRSTADDTIRREIALPNLQVAGSGMGEACMPTDESEAMHFRFVNCTGL